MLLIISILGLLISAILIGIFRRWAIKNLIDIPNKRSSHSQPTPSGGGIGISLVTIIFLTPILIFDAQWTLVAFLLSATVVSILGFIDDQIKLSAKLRLLVQISTVIVLIMITGVISEILIPLIGTIFLPMVLAVAANFFWGLAVTNIYNFMDGIDGLAALQAVVAGVGWTIIFMSVEQFYLALISGLLATTSIGFLYWNRPPAQIFMGDVGSTFLGFCFAMMPLVAFNKLRDPSLLIIGAFMIGPFLFDGTLTIIRRVIVGENILEAHQSHLYQRLVKAGFSHRFIDGVYLPIMILSGLAGLAFWFELNLMSVILALLLLSGIGLVLWVNHIENKMTLSS